MQLDTRTPLMVVAGCNAFHLVLDPVLIFGMGWGVSGAAAATAAAEWAAAAAYLGCLWQRREQLGEYKIFRKQACEATLAMASGGASVC